MGVPPTERTLRIRSQIAHPLMIAHENGRFEAKDSSGDGQNEQIIPLDPNPYESDKIRVVVYVRVGFVHPLSTQSYLCGTT